MRLARRRRHLLARPRLLAIAAEHAVEPLLRQASRRGLLARRKLLFPPSPS